MTWIVFYYTHTQAHTRIYTDTRTRICIYICTHACGGKSQTNWKSRKKVITITNYSAVLTVEHYFTSFHCVFFTVLCYMRYYCSHVCGTWVWMVTETVSWSFVNCWHINLYPSRVVRGYFQSDGSLSKCHKLLRTEGFVTRG